MRAGRRSLVTAALTTALASVGAAPAVADITPTRDAMALARAIADDPTLPVGAEFTVLPPNGNPAAVSTTALGEFPTSGASYGVLSTGDATVAAGPNRAGDTGTENGGTPLRGARDVTTLRIDFDVPTTASCVSLRFRFYSEEFPEYVGARFNDAFIVELDESTWDASGTASPTIRAPRNIAYDTRGNLISVNGAGPASVSRSLASGSTYDAATQRLRASVPVTPGRHSLFLTIFDQGDQLFDSTVLLDRLSLSNLTPCVPGAAADVSEGTPAGAVTLPNGQVSIPAANVFAPAHLLVDRIAFRPERLRSRRPVTATVRVRDTRDFLVRGAKVTVKAVPGYLLQGRPTARTGQDGEAVIQLRPSRRLRLVNGGRLNLYVCVTKPGGREDEGVSSCRLVQQKLSAPRRPA